MYSATFFITFISVAVSVNSQYNNYVACFKQGNTKWLSQPVLNTPVYSSLCRTTCTQRDTPLMAFQKTSSSKGMCFCGSQIPDRASQAPGSSCAMNVPFVSLYYNHYSNKDACHVDYVSMDPAHWNVKYGSSNNKFISGNNTNAMTMAHQSGTNMYRSDSQTFGMICVNSQVSGIPGAITAFYLSNDPQNQHTSQDEIDFEWINAYPCSGVGCLWTNHFVNGVQYNPSLLGQSQLNFKTYGGYHSYCLNWQTDKIEWFTDGRLVSSTHSNVNPIPQKPLNTIISFWTDVGNKFNWGGQLDWNAVVYSFLSGEVRIRCY